MARFYFGPYEEDGAFPKQYWQQYMKENFLNEIELRAAKIEYGTDYFFCSNPKIYETGLKGNCGAHCDQYSPRNGKNGRCRFSKNCYEPVGDPIILKRTAPIGA